VPYTTQFTSACAIEDVCELEESVPAGAVPLEERLGEARGRQRYRRALITGLTSVSAKGVTLLSSLILVPLTFRHLGPERYGVWMTVTSMIQFLTFADLGIGNGLTLRVAAAQGRDDQEDVVKSISCAFFFLLGMCVAICSAVVVLAVFCPWRSWLGRMSVLPATELGAVILILILCTAWSMPLGTALRVQLGCQQGYVADLWNSAGSLVSLAGVLLVIRHFAGLPALVLAAAGCPVLVLAVNWAAEFGYRQKAFRPRPGLFEAKTALLLASTGLLFFVQQCFGLIYYLSDNLVIARTMGAAAVAQYAIQQRIFSLGLVTQYLIAPLWPAINEAVSRGDTEWAKRTSRRAICFALLLSVLLATCLLLLSRPLVQRWTGTDPGMPGLLQFGFAAWVVVVGYVATMNALLNRPAVMLRHLGFFGAASLTSLALKIYFARSGWIPGVIWATVIGFGVVYALPAALLALRADDIQGEEVSA
jgi:O-antigen/teichoic acid export membrane protein